MKSHLDLKKLIGTPPLLYEKYQKKIRLSFVPENEIMPREWPAVWKTIQYKAYPRFKELFLPKPHLPLTRSLKQSLTKRSSLRNFCKTRLSKKTVSTLLYYSSGINDKRGGKSRENRFYPSGGKRYPLEIYVISIHTDIPQGIYHYYVRNHSLEELPNADMIDIRKAFTLYNQRWTTSIPLFFVITAIIRRSEIKYGERAYRLSLLEAGHLGQNIYLLSSALNVGCCEIAGFIDQHFEHTLDIDGLNESVVSVFGLGKWKK